MAKEVFEIDSKLSENLKLAKAELKVAQLKVEAAEIAIYNAGIAALPEGKFPEKGTLHFTGVKVAVGVTEKWSDEELAKIEPKWPSVSNLPFPFKKTYKADGKSISYIRENAQAAYDVLAEALTVTPKKPSFDLEEVA